MNFARGPEFQKDGEPVEDRLVPALNGRPAGDEHRIDRQRDFDLVKRFQHLDLGEREGRFKQILD